MMNRIINPFLFLCFLTHCNTETKAQSELKITDTNSEVSLMGVNKDYPLLKILLPAQADAERGIEVEFPGHVTGLKRNLVSKIFFNNLQLKFSCCLL